MAHAFDPYGFGQLLLDAERQVEGARDHERQLVGLVTFLEHDDAARVHTVASVRQLCIEARAQRQLAETMLTRLVGGAATLEGAQRILVLVVDDSDDSRETTATILEDAGFSAMTATNGLDGVIVAHYAQPSVILMDVTMPVLNGLEAARLIHASPMTRHLKVVAFTAKPEVFEGPVTTWFVDVLRKPASPEAIVTAVKRFVTTGRSAPSPDGSQGV